MTDIEPHMMDRQLALEAEMRSLGIDRYRAQATQANEQGRSASRPSVRRLLEGAHERIVAAIEMFMVEARSGKAGVKHNAVEPFEQMGDKDLLAHLAIRVVLDRIGEHQPLTKAALHLGSLIEDELFYRDFKEQLPKPFAATKRKLEVKNNERYKRHSARTTGNKMGVEHEGWPKRKMLLVGKTLLELVVATTDLVRVVKGGGASQAPEALVATDETLAWLEGEDARKEWMAPLFMPCIVPPKSWTSPRDGGYHSGRVRRLTLVKTHDQAYLSKLAETDLSQVYGALNALQETAWSVNGRVLSVMQALWESGSDIGAIPQADDIPLPTKPVWLVEGFKKEDMTPPQLEAFKQWTRMAAQVHENNVRLRGKRIAFLQMLRVAERFEKEASIFFPHQLDFRGRAYPVPLYLQPQGNDAQRGLLTFANEVPINDEDAARWLAIHGAGLWGIDKVSFDDRVEWVEQHEEQLLAVSRDPLAHRFWADAEKPWQALAFAFEWASFKQEGFGFLSSLPVQMDGSCNGLQNFSAILRDEVGGAAVNLVPADKPSDIYQQVADLVAKQVAEDAAGFDAAKAKLAQGWVGNINRKVCKRPVMTLAYGAKAYGYKQMIFDDTVTPWRMEKPATFPFEGSGWTAAEYLGGVIWSCVGQVVVAARAAMDWLQEAAKVASEAGMPVTWTTPVGLPVKQAYMVSKSIQIETTFLKVRFRPRLTEDTEHLDPRKQSSGLAPNWIHSLDAAHMMRTINAAHALGLRSFSFIHDSYGTHAGNAHALGIMLREEFVRMYSERDVLDDFAEGMRFELPPDADLLPLPKHGTLDLQAVLDSHFFFA
jgi:DNA-directed RNA polymerase, mitochondrial